MSISIASFLPLISAIFVLILGGFVFLKNRKSKLNTVFFLLSTAIIVWLFGTFMLFISKTDNQAIFWDRFVYLGVIIIPSLMYHFSLVFSKTKNPKLLYLGYFLSFIFLILSRTDYFVADLFRYKWGVHTQAKIFHHIFLVFFSIYLFLFYYKIYRYYKKTKGLEHNQAKYIFISFLLLLFGSLGYLPAYGIGIYPFAYLSGVIFVVVLAYAIVKYRLMDIRVAVKRSTIFSGIVIAVTASYALTAFLFSQTLAGDGYTFKSQLIIGLIVAVLVAFGFRPLYEFLKITTDSFLFKGEYRPQELMADITDVLSRTLDLDKVIKTLREKIISALRVGEMEVVVLEENEINQGQPFRTRPLRGRDPQGSPLLSIKGRPFRHALASQVKQGRAFNGNPLYQKFIDYFKKQRDVLVLEELQRKYADRIKFDQSFLLIKEMEKLKTALLVPLFLKEKLIGLFLLGAKKSGDMFTNEDIKTMETVGAQAAIAIENSRLYEEMKDFSKTLQKEVERQTKTLKEANIKLEQLDKAKSEFVSIASHQLRTPLSVIKGYISMLLEGLWGEVSPEQKRHLEMVYLSNERLIKLIEDLLMVSRIEAGRLEFDFQMVSLSDIAENVVNELKPLADKKGLYLRYEKPAKPLPKIKADPLKIRQVVMNLIDNAIHYTEKGGAAVRLKQEKDKIIFSIQDTGIGIPEKEKVTLFEKFSRGKGVSKLHTEGTGLGLYLAAKLVEAHQGRIWAESEGEGKGSTFYFELGAGK